LALAGRSFRDVWLRARLQTPKQRGARPAAHVAPVLPQVPPQRRRSWLRTLLLVLLLLCVLTLLLLLRLAPPASTAPAAARRGRAPEVPRCAASLSAAALADIVPDTPLWADWAATLADDLAAPRHASSFLQEKASVGT
jgi:hypothetical protein